jgi:glycosyltransferase involved in cell wall biosynthesis
MYRTPLMIVGDGPQEHTGLGRILRDLARRIQQSNLPVDLVTVGGPVPPVWTEWRHFPLDERLHRGDDWGASYVEALYRSYFGDQPGVLWLIWDPSRLVYYQGIDLPVQKWAYTAIDAGNGVGSVGGPAAVALATWDRVITYGRWASEVVKTVRRQAVPYLPHGISPVHEMPTADDGRAEFGPHLKREDLLIGCVATNQTRKDLGLFFQTLGVLKDRGLPVYGWLHTDVLVKAWSIQQLVEDCGLGRRVTVSTKDYSDAQLRAMYRACAVTIAPGLGEGFGYPIVESLAAGVPVVHGDFGGGRELIPKREWRFPVREIRLEGIYACQRPVFRAADVANAIERVLEWRAGLGDVASQAYCRGAVAHLDWQALWPRWYSWIKKGL